MKPDRPSTEALSFMSGLNDFLKLPKIPRPENDVMTYVTHVTLVK